MFDIYMTHNAPQKQHNLEIGSLENHTGILIGQGRMTHGN